MFYFLRSILFLLSAEKAHYFTLNSLKFLIKIPVLNWFINNSKAYNAKNQVKVMGITFPNKLGLAAGFDKNAQYLDVFKALGFGHIEIGTVTPLGQEGNPKPRLFRLVEDQAVINRMGFNNDGVDAIVERLKNRPKDLIIGGNIGKNKITPNEDAASDYQICFNKLYPYVDYFTVNVSSPNTPGLRELQDKKPLTDLLNSLIDLREEKVKAGLKALPILLKIAPDLNEHQLNDIISIIDETQIDGIVATNTTIERKGLKTSEETIQSIGMGGLSGKPVLDASTAILTYLKNNLKH
jgi:dihydroorotate dehydrogenase